MNPWTLPMIATNLFAIAVIFVAMNGLWIIFRELLERFAPSVICFFVGHAWLGAGWSGPEYSPKNCIRHYYACSMCCKRVGFSQATSSPIRMSLWKRVKKTKTMAIKENRNA